MPASDTAPALDDETTAALTLFNTYVKADRERTQREKRIKKAERAKDEAASVVKKLGDGGSAEKRAEAEEAYRAAAERWKALRDGKEPEPAPAKKKAEEAQTTPDPTAEEADASDSSTPEDARADADATAPETSAEETPAEETPAEDTPAEEAPVEAAAATEDTPAEDTPADKAPAESADPAPEEK